MSITNSPIPNIEGPAYALPTSYRSGERDLYKSRTGQESIAHDVLLAQARQQADDLRRQLEEYEGLAGSRTMTLQVQSLSDLPTALIHARLASGLTQSDLARRLG
jgi:hypothetical protein